MAFDEQVLRDALTAEQYDAATAPEREVLALACAGSGKSRTLAYRIARLIALGEDPSEIVAFTFTEKAAESIKLRVADEATFDWLEAMGDDVHAIPVTRSSFRRRSAGRLADGAGSCSRLPAACKRRC
jgi:ATP-dependent exoDNAse (exonuclease V) beta subunit